jgi:hypothetical protein
MLTLIGVISFLFKIWHVARLITRGEQQKIIPELKTLMLVSTVSGRIELTLRNKNKGISSNSIEVQVIQNNRDFNNPIYYSCKVLQKPHR